MNFIAKNGKFYIDDKETEEGCHLIKEDNNVFLLYIKKVLEYCPNYKISNVLKKINTEVQVLDGFLIEKTLVMNTEENFCLSSPYKLFKKIKNDVVLPKNVNQNILCVRYNNSEKYLFYGISLLNCKIYNKNRFRFDKKQIKFLDFFYKTNFVCQVAFNKNCEDAPPVSENNYFIICDGLGGRGYYPVEINGIKATNAYFGSRFVSETVQRFFSDNFDEIFKKITETEFINQNIAKLKKIISEKLDDLSKKYNKAVNSNFISFPTTLASVFSYRKNNEIYVLSVYCGDSLIYGLNSETGLFLINKDSKKNDDNDIMNDYVSGGRNFSLNYSVSKFEEPIILFACSDGFYEQCGSILYFEYFILKSVLFLSSDDKIEFNDFFEEISDDTSIAGIIYGNRQSFKKRFDDIEDLLTKKMTDEEFFILENTYYQTQYMKSEELFGNVI